MIPPVPRGFWRLESATGLDYAFTEAQMQGYGRQCARAALEQAVSSIRQADAWRGGHGQQPSLTSEECIELIRSIQSLLL